MTLRLKSDIMDWGMIQQWCRIGIILDSDIEDIKYVLELTDNGFVRTEYVQRVLALKAENQTFGIRKLNDPLTKEQSVRLRSIADFLTLKLSPDSGNFNRIFNLDKDMEEDLKEIIPPGLKIRMLHKLTGEEKNERRRLHLPAPDFDFDPDSEGDEDDGNYVDMTRTALKDSRRILGEITPNSPLFEMIHEIFNIFSGRLTEDDDDVANVKLDGERDDGKQRLELLSLPKFVNYFKVANADDEYLDNFIDRVSVLAEQEFYVDHGIDFNHLLRELHNYGFLLGCEITEKEPMACIQAQMML